MPKVTQHNGSQTERELEPSQDPSPHACCPSVGHRQGPGQDSLAILGQPGGWAEPGRTEAHSHPTAFCSQEACQVLFGLRVGAQALLGGRQGACVWHRDAGRSALTPPAQCPGPRAPSPTHGLSTCLWMFSYPPGLTLRACSSRRSPQRARCLLGRGQWPGRRKWPL